LLAHIWIFFSYFDFFINETGKILFLNLVIFNRVMYMS
jgi:hypothetical protein